MRYERGFIGLFLSVFVSMFMSCAEDIDSKEDGVKDNMIYFDWVESEGARNVLQRAAQMALITWTPLAEIPWN